ncbi:hypothetical protein HK102_003603 [Quaeritorhiza haematococci]|nr:hypothetical protein HK102_003603 [Quaeritorhiza haematococci]
MPTLCPPWAGTGPELADEHLHEAVHEIDAQKLQKCRPSHGGQRPGQQVESTQPSRPPPQQLQQEAPAVQRPIRRPRIQRPGIIIPNPPQQSPKQPDTNQPNQQPPQQPPQPPRQQSPPSQDQRPQPSPRPSPEPGNGGQNGTNGQQNQRQQDQRQQDQRQQRPPAPRPTSQTTQQTTSSPTPQPSPQPTRQPTQRPAPTASPRPSPQPSPPSPPATSRPTPQPSPSPQPPNNGTQGAPWRDAFATHFGPHDGTNMNALVCKFQNIRFPFAAVSDTSPDLWRGDKCGVRQRFQPPSPQQCRRNAQGQMSLPDGSGFRAPECPAALEQGGVCGRCLEVRCKSTFEGDTSICNNRVETVKIVDVCPEIHPNNVCKRLSADRIFADPRRNCGNFGGNSVDLDRDVMNRIMVRPDADRLGNIQIQFRPVACPF